MNAYRRGAVALLWVLFVLATGCNGLTTPDEDDRAAIIRAVMQAKGADAPDGGAGAATLGYPDNPVEAWLMNRKASQWLSGKSKNQRVSKVQCQFLNKDTGDYGPAKDAGPELTVEAVVSCLTSVPTSSYWMCVHEWAEHMSEKTRKDVLAELMKKDPNTSSLAVDCWVKYDPGFAADEAPASVMDPSVLGPDDIGEAFIGAPMPPPGWVLPASTWEIILPMICLSGTPWGCPVDPAYPNPNEPAPTMGPGDYWTGDSP